MDMVGGGGAAVFVLARSLTSSTQKIVVPVSLLFPPVSPAQIFSQTPKTLVIFAVVGSMGAATCVHPVCVAATAREPSVICE